jgi:phage/plasmid-associated DNA primase
MVEVEDGGKKKKERRWAWESEVKQTREKALIAWTVFKDGFQIDAETGALHRWVGTHWNGEDGAGEKSLQRWLAWWLDSMAWRNTSTVGEVSHELVRRLLVKMPADLVAEKGILPCRNGCLRLADRVLLPHAPEMGNTWVLSYGYDPSASAQPILDFLHECLENREDVQVLRAGLWAAVRRLGVKALLELVGKGDSGKSVVAALAIALVGDGAAGVSTLERIEDPRQRFETVKMRGKALAIFNEVQNYVGPLEVLKAMTGRD